jgi:flavin reductase (DIM6/NTAB) family NADH-FMN oxidoreductase RutF
MAYSSDGLVDADRFRDALRGLATGVAVVTSWHEGRPWGMTVSACCSISSEPPRVLVSLHRDTRSRHTICADGAFGVCVLHSAQKDVAEHAARAGEPKFLDGFCEPAADGPPVLRGAVAHLACVVDRTFDVGDHTLVIGNVRDARGPGADRAAPLVYFDRAYRHLGAHA